MTTTRYCLVESCGEPLGKKCKSDMCARCRKGLRYWDDRPYQDVVEYQSKLAYRAERIGLIRKPKSKPAVSRKSASTRAEARA